jgi:hypothetical protein
MCVGAFMRVEEMKTRILCSIIFFPDNCAFIRYGRIRQDTDDSIIQRMRVACRITKATDTHTQICNIYCLSTVIVVTRTRLIVPLYIRCPCCLR